MDSLSTCDMLFTIQVDIATSRPIGSSFATRYIQVMASSDAEAIRIATQMAHFASIPFHLDSVMPTQTTILDVRI